MKKLHLTLVFLCLVSWLNAQNLTLPAGGFNQKSGIWQRIGITDVKITWDAPGVKGREGQIFGTTVVHYGFQNLGFGTSQAAPWRAGANECTTFEVSTDVKIDGQLLPKGKYGFFIAVYPDSCTLLFSKNSQAWGSFFYDPADDALRVTVRQQKNLPGSREWLAYTFSDPTENSAVVALEWERWRIPFTVSVDLAGTVIASMRRELQSSTGFIGSNWQYAAQFCLQKETNLEEALTWANNAINPPLGIESFSTLQLKAQILEKLKRTEESEKIMQAALDKATILEMHGYGRQLISQKKPAKALEVFLANFKKNGDTWPTHVGLARGYSAAGDLQKALEHAKIALPQAPDDLNRKSVEGMIKTLSSGKALGQ